ncbi:hypothetical protein KKC13_04775 [bacterium]|nr:hypothetical protein [bacterium]MBU1958541.1 hypothetical protein [bacterium]
MFKLFALTVLSLNLLFAATSEQVDQYMSLSHSDRALIEVEQMFENLSQSMETLDNNRSDQITLSYEMYIGKHISEDEMEELLAIYRKPVMQRYVVEMDTIEIPKEEMEEFLRTLKENPLSTERMDIINNIVENIINEETMLSFYKSMMQRYIPKEDNSNKETNSSTTKELDLQEKQFIEMMKEATKKELLYGTQVLSMEEMREINDISKSSLMTKVMKVENEAVIEIVDNFIKLIISEPKSLEILSKD